MGNEEQPNYYGWQYEQDHPEEAQPPPVPPHVKSIPPLPAQYQEPVADMGTSLGYGQGIEYQYSDAPQPSQPIPRLRQQRLQELQSERIRRQRRPGNASFIPSKWKSVKQPLNNKVLPPSRSVSSPLSEKTEKRPLRQHGALQPASQPAQDTGMIQRSRIGHAALILMGAFVASRVLGLLRTAMFAFVFGTSSTSDAYLQAFLIPDLIFNIVAGGALSSAFIPVFTKYMVAEHDEKTAWHIASSALNLAIAIVVSLALIAIVFARQLVPFYNPGIHDASQLDLIATLTRIMLLQAIIMGAGVIITSVLNARANFLSPAIGTVLYNVGLIAGLFPGIYFAFHGQRSDTIAVYAATWGVVLGALLQIAVQIPGLFKVNMRYTPSFDWRHPEMLQIGRQMLPRIINAMMLYLAIFVDRSLILLLVVIVGQKGINGLITQYYQAWQLVLLPLGVFGMAVSTAAFPTLAENVAKGRLDRVRATVLETLRGILFMSIPSSIGLMVLGLPIIQVLLEHGRYSLSDAQSTVVPLAFFALGLTGMAAVEILTRAFYALRDSTMPVIVSVGQFIFKIALSLLLINVAIWGSQWGMGALAFSTSLAALLEAVILFWLLYQRLGDLGLRVIALFVGKVMLAALAMGVGLLITRAILDALLSTTSTQSLGLSGTIMAFVKLLIELFVGIFIYVRVARKLEIEELGPVKRVLDRLKLSWI